eukprot:54093-Rhodomonas_salina.2
MHSAIRACTGTPIPLRQYPMVLQIDYRATAARGYHSTDARSTTAVPARLCSYGAQGYAAT